ncbi:MAG: polyprenyl synthetase family protein [Planctomycetota bacterium]|nr:polyprenyl synthetase family protein [Planctomycetota bacterium]
MSSGSEQAGVKPKSGAAAYLERSRAFVDACLEKALPPETAAPTTLHKAIRYSIFAGGKRLRPALAFAAAEAVGGSWDDAAPVGCAVEMIHTYSLIHDDLPAMDDDDLRRGRPTCHKVFGDAIAILSGDGLLTYAFEVLATCRRTEAIPGVIKAVATGSGTVGMVGGQVLDLEGEGKPATEASVAAIHRWKTAALITASCEAGALSGGASLKEAELLRNYGQKIGLAFQIVDDILDLTASPETLGKTPGKDLQAQKATYPAVMGIERAKLEAQRLMDAAKAELQALGARAQHLEDLALFVVERKS